MKENSAEDLAVDAVQLASLEEANKLRCTLVQQLPTGRGVKR